MENTIKSGDLTKHERIGKGASAKVYRATLKTEDRDLEVAAKTIEIDHKDEIELEVDILATLDHENVIKYYGHYVTEEDVTIVTEYAANGSLHDYLTKLRTEQKRLSVKQIQQWGVQVARAIKYLKEKGLVHRDIKSSNLLISADDKLKLCDFGISKKLKDGTVTTFTGKGTTRWLAPEVFKYKKVSAKADIFGLGVVLWEMITGKFPWEGIDDYGIMIKVGHEGERLAIPMECPVEIRNLLDRCWEANRDERPNIGKVLDILEEWASTCTSPLQAPPDPDKGADIPDARPIEQQHQPLHHDHHQQQQHQPLHLHHPNPQQQQQEQQRLQQQLSPVRYPVQETENMSLEEGAPPLAMAIGHTADTIQPRQVDLDKPLKGFENDTALRIKTKILAEAGKHLCPHLDPRNIILFLKTKTIISFSDKEEVCSAVTTSGKVEKMLDVLVKRSIDDYYTFMASLEQERPDLYKQVKGIEHRIIREYGGQLVENLHITRQRNEPIDLRPMSDGDLHQVIDNLGPDELQKLYIALGLVGKDIEKQEKRADTKDVDLRAFSVLRFWQEQKGTEATKERILAAISRLQLNQVREELEEIWDMGGDMGYQH